MDNYNEYLKYFCVLIIGIILGFLISRIEVPALSSISTNGSIKVIGSENAPITMTEYSDFQCPLCHKYFTETYPTLYKDYIKTGKVKYVFKYFPLKNIHAQANLAALAAECALEQNKFWEMHDQIFQTQDKWSDQANAEEQFRTLAANLGLDKEQFNSCLSSHKYQNNIDLDFTEGVNQQVKGTPTFRINNETIVGAQDAAVFSTTLNRLLHQ